MRHLQAGLVDPLVPVEQEVEVERPRAAGRACPRVRPNSRLDPKQQLEELARRRAMSRARPRRSGTSAGRSPGRPDRSRAATTRRRPRRRGSLRGARLQRVVCRSRSPRLAAEPHVRAHALESIDARGDDAAAAFGGAGAGRGAFSLVEVAARQRPVPPADRRAAALRRASALLARARTRACAGFADAGLVRAGGAGAPARARGAQRADPLLASEWWLAPVGADEVVAPGPGVPGRGGRHRPRPSASGVRERAEHHRAEHAERRRHAGRLPRHRGRVRHRRAGKRHRDGRHLSAGRALRVRRRPLRQITPASSSRESTPPRASDASSSTSASASTRVRPLARGRVFSRRSAAAR